MWNIWDQVVFFQLATIMLLKEEREEGMFNDCAVRDDLSI